MIPDLPKIGCLSYPDLMADIVNLRQARKKKNRLEKQSQAEQNRLTHGRSKADKRQIRSKENRKNRDLDGKKLD